MMKRVHHPPTPVPKLDKEAVELLRTCLSPACFWPPEQLGPQPAWLEHAPFALWLIEVLRPRVLVELGTHGGYSYFAFCQAVQRLQLETRCYAVDTWKGDEQAGYYGEEVYQQVRTHHDRLYSTFSTLIRSSFDEALPHFSDGTVDLLHVDGHHFYEDVKHDFESWRPKLSDRGVVLFHDTNVRERNFGVVKLWEELRALHPHFEFLHGHGLGVLGVGSKVPDPIRPLFAATGNEEATTHICSAYSRLGSSLALQFSAERQIAELTQRVAETSLSAIRTVELEAALQTQSAEAARLVASTEVRVKQLEQMLETRSAAIVRADTELAAERNRTGELEQALEARSAALARVDAELATARNRAAELESAVAAQVRELQAIKASTSWRLTSLLRKSAGRFPWLARQVHRSIKLLWWTATFQLVSRFRIRRRQRLQLDLISSSRLLDRDWYLQTYLDVRQSGADPTVHYMRHGAIEGRDPGPLFNTEWYLAQNPDVAASGMNPLVHYVRYGAAEGRLPGLQSRGDRKFSHPAKEGGAQFATAMSLQAPHDLASWCTYFGEATEGEIRRLELECRARGLAPLSIAIVAIASSSSDPGEDARWREALSKCEAPLLVLLGGSKENIQIWQRRVGPRTIVESVDDLAKIAAAGNSLIALVRPRCTPSAVALKLAGCAMALCPDARSLYFDEAARNSEGLTSFKAWPDFGTEAVRQFVIDPGVLITRLGVLHARGGCHADDLLASFPRDLFDKTTIHVPAIGAWTADTNPVAPRPPELALPTSLPTVSVVIPTKDRADLLSVCIEGLLNRTTYPNLEVIILDNNSEEEATLELFRALSKDSRITIIRHSKPFNFAELCNRGVREARGEYVCLMNNDVDVVEPGWLTAMIRHACQADAGAVGALLMYSDGRVQHGGVILGAGGVAAHSLGEHELSLRLTRAHERSAVTAACLVVKRERYEMAGGMNEVNLPVTFNDVDLCLKLQRLGYRNIMEPAARLIHHESASLRDHSTTRAKAFHRECSYIREHWAAILDDDPCYNPNLSLSPRKLGQIEWSRRRVDRLARRLGIAESQPPEFETLHPLLSPYATSSNLERSRSVVTEPTTVSYSEGKAHAGLSIVVPTLDHPEYVIPLCRNLTEAGQKFHRDGLGFDVLIADTGSTNREVLDFYRTLPSFFHVKLDCTYHFAKLNNQMVEAALTALDTLLFLNNDILFDTPAASLRTLYDTLHSEPSCGVIGAVLSFPDGSLQHGGLDVFRDGPLKGFIYHPNAREHTTMSLGEIQPCPAVTGALLMTKADVFRRAGGFDSGYAVECQDAALCLAIRRLGSQTVVANAGRIVHYENGTRKKGEECWPDRQRFMRQWGAWIAYDLFDDPA